MQFPLALASVVFSLGLFCTTLLRAESPLPAPAPGTTPAAAAKPFRAFRLAAVGAVPESDLQRVGAYVAAQSRVEVRYEASLPAETIALSALAKARAALRQPDEVILLLVVAGAATNQPHGFLDVSNRVGVIHFDAMNTPDGEVRLRRLERQALRSLYYTLGMPSCPNPRCCLFPYTNLKELDSIGRNACPPCSFKFQQKAAAAGLAQKPFEISETLRKRLEERKKQAAAGGPIPPAPTPAQP